MATLFCKQEEADTKIFLHCKDASARFRQVIIQTPDTDVFVLALGFTCSLSCESFIKTIVKDKNRIISISWIIDKLKGTYGFQESEIIIQSIMVFHTFTGWKEKQRFLEKREGSPIASNTEKSCIHDDICSIGQQLGNWQNLVPVKDGSICLCYVWMNLMR